MIRSILFMMAGIFIGVAATIASYYYMNRHTHVWTTSMELVGANGMKIPVGTEMIYDKSMSEGFHRAKIYLNLTPQVTDQKIKKTTSEHPFYVSPIWVY